MNYKIEASNYIECTIIKTDEDVDGFTIFNNFTKAKKVYLQNLRVSRDGWNIAIQDAKILTKKDVI